MRKVICAVLVIIIIAMGSTCIAQETDLQETYMSYYRAMIREAVRFDYQDFGEGAVGYQYALVFIDETDTIPSLLLAELTSDE